MPLKLEQIKMLRTLARDIKPTVTIGKDGLSEAVVARTDEVLEAHELVKCSLLDTSGIDAHEAAEQLARSTYSEVVQVIGHRFVLYRETKRKNAKKILG
jgi:RNA-binding protein